MDLLELLLIAIVVALLVAVPRLIIQKYFEIKFSDAVERLISQFGRSRKNTTVRPGFYYSVYWRYNRHREMRMHRGVAMVQRKGKKLVRIRMISEAPNGTLLEGKMDEYNFVTGTWNIPSSSNATLNDPTRDHSNPVGFERNYHGVFQFQISAGYPLILGKWLGFNGSNQINCGIWALSHITSDVSEEASTLLLADLHKFEEKLDDTKNRLFDFEKMICFAIKSGSKDDRSLSLGQVEFDTAKLDHLTSDRSIERADTDIEDIEG